MSLGVSGLAAAILFAAYVPMLYIPRPFMGELPEQKHAALVYFAANSTALMPMMWIAFALLPGLFWRWAHRRHLPPRGFTVMALLIVAVLGLSLRSLFNSHLDELPKVSQAACPAVFLAGPYMIAALARPFGRRAVRPWVPAVPVLLSIAMLGYSGARFLASCASYLQRPVYTLATAAGMVHLYSKESADVYRYVAPRLAAGELLLDVDYGGGVNFATGHLSPSFFTQYQLLRPSADLMNFDLQQVRTRLPRLVIAGTGTQLGTIYGICGNVVCMFPRVPWRSSESACDPDKVYPTVVFLERDYHPVAVIGSKQILEPN
jgi:hypothetical protein